VTHTEWNGTERIATPRPSTQDASSTKRIDDDGARGGRRGGGDGVRGGDDDGAWIGLLGNVR